MGRKNNKKGQVTIWVIVAIVIVGMIILFFALRRLPQLPAKEVFEPQQYIEKCAKDSVNEAVGQMLPQGGFLEPKSFKLYNRTKITYLCENAGYFRPCIQQHPMFINEMGKEILGYIEPRMENCFESMKKDVEDRKGSVEMEKMNLSVSMAPGRIFVDVERKTRVTEGGSTKAYNSFNAEVLSPLYNLANVAIEIANNEAKYCYFEYVGYMILHPGLDIRKFMLSDSTKLYFIKDKQTGETMNIAIRGCAIPAGMGL